MVKDKRYAEVKEAILQGRITLFTQIFAYVPKTVVARDLHIKVDRFNRYLGDLASFKMGTIWKIGELLDIEEGLVHELIRKEIRSWPPGPAGPWTHR